jgi:hypothetical protein
MTVERAVQRGEGHHRITGQDGGPFAERLVASEDEGLLIFVSLGGHLELRACLRGIEGEIV